MSKRQFIRTLLTLVAAGLGSVSFAQEFPPKKSITMVVGFAAGGALDAMSRIIADGLREGLGQPFISDNRAGAEGRIAIDIVRAAAPDGNTLLFTPIANICIYPHTQKNLPYDPRKDLTPISLLARVPFVLVVNPDLPIQSVAELVKLAKEKPGEMSFGTVGPGTFHHLNAEMFKSIFGLDLVHVPYKGTAPALQDVVAGHIPFMFSDVPPAKALIESGKLRALGVTTAQRVKALPNVPPLAEAGIPGFDTSSWHTVTTTGGVPKEIVDKLVADARPDVYVWDVTADPGHGRLQVMIDREGGVDLALCEEIAKVLAPLRETWALEVSSPGMDRPLKKLSDYLRFMGQDVQIKLRIPEGTQRNFSGTIAGCAETQVRLQTETGERAFAFENIEKARLVPKF